MKCQYIQVGGVPTRFFTAGSGPALLLLHGIGMGGDSFLRNIDALAEKYSVIAPDMLGHGMTALPDFAGMPPSVCMAKHVRQLLAQLDVSSCCAVGSSFGGLIASLVYLQDSGLVDAIALVGSGSTCNSAEVQEATLRASLGNALAAMKNPEFESLRKRLRNIVYSDDAVDPALIFSQMCTYSYSDRPEAYAHVINETIDTFSNPEGQTAHRVADLALPILLVAGRDDIRSPLANISKHVGLFPDARLLVYEECGHFPFLEHPQKFHADLIGFIESVRPTASL